MKTPVKICGLRDAETIRVAGEAGARYIGFNFFAKSPRSVTLDQAAALAVDTPMGVSKVGLVVDVDNAFLDDLTARVPLDMLQLHGSESPERVAEVKARYRLPVMKVKGIASAEDLRALESYFDVADQILVDAKAPKGADLPGGNGITFDWTLLQGRRWPVPWMLAGGLTPENVREAMRLTGANQVDVASGVESSAGVKDADLIRAFCANAQSDATAL